MAVVKVYPSHWAPDWPQYGQPYDFNEQVVLPAASTTVLD